MNTKSYQLQVVGHTAGAVKLHEIDGKGEKTIEVQGACYLRKSAVGELPVGAIVEVTIKYGK